jgi:hypothetical protein
VNGTLAVQRPLAALGMAAALTGTTATPSPTNAAINRFMNPPSVRIVCVYHVPLTKAE